MNVTTEDRKNLREALTSGFRNYSSLKIFVSDNFDFRLDEIADSKATKIASDNLIEHFEEGGEAGNIAVLILALYKARPHNPEVQKLMNRLQGFLQQRLVLDPRSAEAIFLPFELPQPYDDVQLESFLPRPLSYEADAGKLLRGLQQCASAVCKVSFTDRATTGTGVLIAPDLVLTNYHVLSKQVIPERSQLTEQAKTLLFEFGFLSEEHNGSVSSDTFTVEVKEPIVACSPPSQLDYVLLRVEPRITGTNLIKPVPLRSTTRLLSSNNELNVLQHPAGNVMQVSLSASGVVQVDAGRGRAWYVNRTQGGSSGSPCFNSEWEMVALHHASISRGFGSVREGILVSSILPEIEGFLG
jgi:V8-like Glu-specific endopeptidase